MLKDLPTRHYSWCKRLLFQYVFIYDKAIHTYQRTYSFIWKGTSDHDSILTILYCWDLVFRIVSGTNRTSNILFSNNLNFDSSKNNTFFQFCAVQSRWFSNCNWTLWFFYCWEVFIIPIRLESQHLSDVWIYNTHISKILVA